MMNLFKFPKVTSRHKLCKCVTVWHSDVTKSRKRRDYWRGISGAVFSVGEDFVCLTFKIFYLHKNRKHWREGKKKSTTCVLQCPIQTNVIWLQKCVALNAGQWMMCEEGQCVSQSLSSVFFYAKWKVKRLRCYKIRSNTNIHPQIY